MAEMTSTVSEAAPTSFFDSLPMKYDRTPGWAAFLERGPVFQADGIWFFTEPSVIKEAERNTKVFSNKRAFDLMGSPVPLIPLSMDPPEHGRYRRRLDPFFSPREINKIEPQLRTFLNELIDNFIDKGSCDIVKDLSTPFPSQVFMTLFGYPLEDLDEFLRLSSAIMHGQGFAVTEEIKQAGQNLNTYLRGVIEDKRRKPADDLLSHVLAMSGEDAWTDDEIVGMCSIFVTAGLDTVRSAIGFTIKHLAEDANLRRQLVANPDLIDPVLQEVLRIEPPAPFIPRINTEDVEIGGVTIPKDSLCVMVMGAANRSSEYGENANESVLKVELGKEPNLSFGSGVHRCIGVHLARRELRLVLEEFHKRIPEYKLVDGFEPTIQFPSLNFLYSELLIEFPTP
jgi:cytochrome P450